MNERLVFIGTYTEPILFGTGKVLQGKGEGIYIYKFDTSTGSITFCDVAIAGPNPSYLTFDPTGQIMYVVNELKEFNGESTGSVSALSVDPVTGTLKFINHRPSLGTDPCHLTVDQSGRFVLVANFMSGSVCVLPINLDGSLGKPSDFIQHQGSSIDPVRQKGPHAHAVTLDNNGKHAFVPDLGLDRLMVYKFDPIHGKLEPNAEPWIDIPAGSGPRQLVLNSRNEYAYLINELNSTVIVFQYENQAGQIREIQTVSTLPEEFEGISTCAEIQLSPSGKFLYASNRGHDSIVVFAINQKDGTLFYVDHTSTQGKSPRHFIIDPDGMFLLVANQDTDNVVIFRIDPVSGKLSDTGHAIQVPTPVCIKIL